MECCCRFFLTKNETDYLTQCEKYNSNIIVPVFSLIQIPVPYGVVMNIVYIHMHVLRRRLDTFSEIFLIKCGKEIDWLQLEGKKKKHVR